MTTVSAQQLTSTWDCAWPGCPRDARRPGGYCDLGHVGTPPAGAHDDLEPGSLAHLIPDSDRDDADRAYTARAAAARSASQQRRRERPWTREQIIDAIRQWAAEHGRPPTTKDWHSWSPDRPTHDVVRSRYGTWGAAIVAAGYPRPKPGTPPRRQERP